METGGELADCDAGLTGGDGVFGVQGVDVNLGVLVSGGRLITSNSQVGFGDILAYRLVPVIR